MLTRDDLNRAVKNVKAQAQAVDREALVAFTKDDCDYTVDGKPIEPRHVMAWGICVGAVAALEGGA